MHLNQSSDSTRVSRAIVFGAALLLVAITVVVVAVACQPTASQPTASQPSTPGTQAVTAIAPSPASAEVNIRWAEAVAADEQARMAAEKDYKLTNPKFDEGDPRKRTWRYVLTDTSAENLRRMVMDTARVEDTHNIDREKFTIR